MKTLTAVFLCSMVVVLSGCSDDKASGPDEPEETLLGTATIGNAGGDLASDDFVLSVPAGAFTASVSIELHELNDSSGFESSSVSPLYRLNGLPDAFGESLHVAIQYSGALTGESYIAYGRETESIEGDHTQTVYAFLPARDSSGFLVAAVPPRNDSDPGGSGQAAGAYSGGNKDFITGITAQEPVYKTPLFNIHYPIELMWSVDELTSYIETAYNMIVAMGLKYELLTWRWPGQLNHVDQVYDKWQHRWPDDVELEIDPSGRTAPVLNVDDWYTETKLPALRLGLGEAMLSIAQSEADPGGWREYKADNNHGWHKAVRQWFQERVSDPASFAGPSGFSGCETFPFKGLQPNLNGCGMSPFVKYLAETEGDAVIGRIYEHIRDGQMFVDAILNSTSEAIYNWLPEFFDRYIRGSYYGVSSAALIASPTGNFTIDSDADTLQSFYRGCPELGAQIYRINLDYDSISSSAAMNLTLEGSGINPDYLTVLLYKYKDNALTYLDAGHDIDLGNLRSLTNDGYDLIAVVVNSYGDAPYTGTSALTLTVKVTTPLVFNFNTAEIRLTGITFDCYEEWEDTTSTFEGHHGASWKATGAFDGNTFTGFDLYVGGEDWVCSTFVSITIDPVTMRLSSFDAATRCGRATYKQIANIRSVPGMELPFMSDWSDLNWHAVGSPDVCGYFDYEGLIYGYPPQYVHWYSRCTNSACIDEDSQIWISIFNESPPGEKTSSGGSSSRGEY